MLSVAQDRDGGDWKGSVKESIWTFRVLRGHIDKISRLIRFDEIDDIVHFY